MKKEVAQYGPQSQVQRAIKRSDSAFAYARLKFFRRGLISKIKKPHQEPKGDIL